MTEYVVCPACGTRIKAGRSHCLRCFELLPPPGTVSEPPIWVSLGWSPRKQLAVGISAALAALALVVVIWRTQPQQADDADAGAVPPAASVAPSRAPAAPVAAPAATAAVSPTGPDAPPPRLRGDEGEEQVIDTPRPPADGDVASASGRYQQTLAHFKLARAAADGGQWTRAIEEYGAASRLSPDDAAARFNLGLALHQRGDERDAIAAFQKAIALEPGAMAFHVPLGAAFERVGQIADAVREYKAFVATAGDSGEADRVRNRIELLSTGNPGSGKIR